MAINFNSLPTGKPVNLPEKGTYYATIESAEMKQGRDVTKPPYLNMFLRLKDKEGNAAGGVYDILAESDSDLIQYKLVRFLTAVGLTNLKTFELNDLVKLVKGKQIIVDIKTEEKEGYTPKAVVDLFSGNIYYPLSDASEIFGTVTVPAASKPTATVQETEDELNISADDAADVHSADSLDEF